MSYKALLSIFAVALLCISASGCQNNQTENSSTETTATTVASEVSSTTETVSTVSSDNADSQGATISGVPVDTPVIDMGETDLQNNSETSAQQTDNTNQKNDSHQTDNSISDDSVLISDIDEDGNLIEPAPPETQEIQNTSEYNYDEFGNVDID